MLDLNASLEQPSQSTSIKDHARSHRRVSLGTLFGIITAVLYISYKAGYSSAMLAGRELVQESAQLKNTVSQLQSENATFREKLTVLEREFQIQIETKKHLGNHLKVLQDQNAEITRDLALYHSIAGTPAVGQGLQLKAFQVFTTDDPRTFRYLLILSKQAEPKKYAEGAVKMTILGRAGNKPIQLSVKYVDSSREDGLAFKFKHFQELTGELSFPTNFVPESVLFQVDPDKEWPHFQEQFPWNIDNAGIS